MTAFGIVARESSPSIGVNTRYRTDKTRGPGMAGSYITVNYFVRKYCIK
jgi:hypothetical protein